jgi:hypothetical protein
MPRTLEALSHDLRATNLPVTLAYSERAANTYFGGTERFQETRASERRPVTADPLPLAGIIATVLMSVRFALVETKPAEEETTFRVARDSGSESFLIEYTGLNRAHAAPAR